MFQYIIFFDYAKKAKTHTAKYWLGSHFCQNYMNQQKTITVKKPKKVIQFADKPNVWSMYVWAMACKEARRGIWEQIGRDRGRFEKRINDCGRIISPVLTEKIERIAENLQGFNPWS